MRGGQRRKAVERRQPVVGKNHVGRLRRQNAKKVLLCVHALQLKSQTAPLQGTHHQRRFSGDILYENNANFRVSRN